MLLTTLPSPTFPKNVTASSLQVPFHSKARVGASTSGRCHFEYVYLYHLCFPRASRRTSYSPYCGVLGLPMEVTAKSAHTGRTHKETLTGLSSWLWCSPRPTGRTQQATPKLQALLSLAWERPAVKRRPPHPSEGLWSLRVHYCHWQFYAASLGQRDGLINFHVVFVILVGDDSWDVVGKRAGVDGGG